MKKLVILGFLVALTQISVAQRAFRFTFLASPQLTWLSSDETEVKDRSPQLGIDYGVEADIFLGSENYALVTGLTLSQVGARQVYNTEGNFAFDGEALSSGTSVDYNLKFLEIPFALKMRSRDFDRANFFAQFGLTNWINIGAKATTVNREFDNEGVNEEIRLFNIGMNIGLGAEYDLGSDNAVTAALIYNGGFSDTTTNHTVKDKSTLRTLRLRLGFIF